MDTKMTETKKLLITAKKGSSWRMLDLDSRDMLRLMNNEIPHDFDVMKGSILICNYEKEGNDLICDLKIADEIIATIEKKKEIVENGKVRVGDVFEGAIIQNLGKCFPKNGKKVQYAYFK